MFIGNLFSGFYNPETTTLYLIIMGIIVHLLAIFVFPMAGIILVGMRLIMFVPLILSIFNYWDETSKIKILLCILATLIFFFPMPILALLGLL